MAATINQWIGTTNDYGVTTNWSQGHIPATGENVILTQSSQSISASLGQSGVALARFDVDMSMTGLVSNGGNGTTAGYLNIQAANSALGLPSPTGTGLGSRRLNLNYGSTTTNLVIENSATAGQDANQQPLRILGTNLNVTMLNGLVSFGAAGGESPVLNSLTMINGGGQTGPYAYLGATSTITTLSAYAGQVVNNSLNAVTSATVGSAATGAGSSTYTVSSLAAHTALTINSSGRVFYNGTGTITTLTVNGGGTLDLSGGAGTVTVTNKAIFYAGAKIKDPLGRLAFSAGFTVPDGAIDNIDLNIGFGRSYPAM